MGAKIKAKKGKVTIHIKEKNKGALHREMGIPQGEKISEKDLAAEKAKAKSSGDAKLMKRVVFAQNFGGHNKKDQQS